MKTLFFPDGDGGVTPATPAAATQTPGIPQADLDFLHVAEAVDGKWLITPAIKLLWIDQPTYSGLVGTYKTTLTSRISTGSTRSEQTQKLDNIDLKIDQGVKEVRAYIADKYTTANAKSYYAQFGIVHSGSHYEMPVDHDDRKTAIQMMIDAIALHGFGAKPFGTAFWTQAQTDFNAALTSANTIDGSVSGDVGNKNNAKKKIKQAMNSLRLVIRANYPDTYKTEWRTWGWQKEDY